MCAECAIMACVMRHSSFCQLHVEIPIDDFVLLLTFGAINCKGSLVFFNCYIFDNLCQAYLNSETIPGFEVWRIRGGVIDTAS